MPARGRAIDNRGQLRPLFLEHCRPQGKVFCPRCVQQSVYVLKDGRFRCKACLYPFHDFTGRWLNRCNLSQSQWLALVRLFVEGVPVTEMANEVQASYETTLKAMHTLRLSILAHDPSFRSLFNQHGELRGHCRKDRAGSEGHCLGERAPVFGLHRRSGRIHFELAKGLVVADVLSGPLKKKLWRTMVYTEESGGFDALFFSCCANLRKLYAKKWDQSFIRLDEDRVFWDTAGQWLTRYRCFTPEYCPLYLKEFEFRFNHPRKNWFPLVLQHLCQMVSFEN